jgi:predicted nucleic acid-binding protein
MSAFLLDTSAILSHFRQETGWQRVQEIFEGEADVLIAAPTLTELIRRLRELGFSSAEAQETTSTYRELVTNVEAIDATTALSAWRIIDQNHNRLPLIDALIAAAALERKAVLVHRDKHMAAIPSSLLAQEYLG